MDPVFAMDESFFLDGGSRLDDVEESALAQVSAWRSVAYREANVPEVARCQNECVQVGHGSRTSQSGNAAHRRISIAGRQRWPGSGV